MAQGDLLFNKMDAFSVMENARRAMIGEIAGVDRDRLLNTNADDLAAYFADRFSLTVPSLNEAGKHADQEEVPIDVSQDWKRDIRDRSRPFHIVGTRITVVVPFEGEPKMFRVQPSTHNSMPPRGRVERGALIFTYQGTNLTTEKVRVEIDSWLASVKQYLDWQRQSLKGFNENLLAMARDVINQRRTKLLADQSLVAGLGIPLKRRSDAPMTYTAPEVRRKAPPKMPPATIGPYKPEPVLEMAEYEHILDVIQSMVKVMERSPRMFHDLGEEEIRSHFLVQLNGHYQGDATGETFNYQGKTDILIRSGDRNIFIAECKFWDGPASLIATIDQLLGYLSWRDSKAAILLFNRNKDFSKVLAAIPPVAKAHPQFRTELPNAGETAFRYTFRHKDDEAKDIIVTILVFDVPRPD